VIDLRWFIFKQLLVSVYADFRLAVYAIGDEVSSFDELFTYNLMKASIFITCGLSLPKILSCAKLSKIFSSFGTDITEQFECDPSNLLFVGVQIKENNRVILAP
jgi:hypothetical protein